VSDKKKGQILDFPLPVCMKQLKSFLGLANYSRPHIPHYSEVARPLHAMLIVAVNFWFGPMNLRPHIKSFSA
jgi:hypothetical protein